MDAQSRVILCARQHERALDLDLRGAVLMHTHLANMSADRINWQGADLRQANFRAARLGSCRFEQAHLEATDWVAATLRLCNFDRAYATGACFDQARLEDSSATGADLTRATLREARLTETSFARAVLFEAVFTDAQGEGVSFRGADLRGAQLNGAQLDEADFRGADLRGADLSNGRFQAADFRGALLDNTRFTGAELTAALFDQAPERDTAKAANGDDDALLAALRQAVADLHGAPADNPLAAVQTQVQQALASLGKAAAQSPADALSWLGGLAEMAQRGENISLRDILAHAQSGTGGLQELLQTNDTPAAEIFDKLQSFIAALDENPDQCPEEWRAWLEPLLQQADAGQRLDWNEIVAAITPLLPPLLPPQRGAKRRRPKRSKQRKSRRR